MLVSFVIACYYSEKTIGKVVEGIIDQFKDKDGYDCEFVLVNDGSKDGTFDVIKSLCDKYPFVKGINLMRNFGQHNALMAALRYAKGDYVMGMDDDMQTHPSQVFKLIHKIEEGYDIVYGRYPDSKNGFFKKLSSSFNIITSQIMLDMPKDIVESNFWILTDKVKDEVIKYKSFNPMLDAIFYGNVEVEHYKRESGKSGYTLRKLIRLWLSYWNYSVMPLRVSFMMGALAGLLGLIVTIWLIYKKLTDPMLPMGWASTLCLMTMLFAVVLMVLGVVGEYLGKAILILNNTPQYIIRETNNLEDSDAKEEAQG